jgi:hypothetical protein
LNYNLEHCDDPNNKDTDEVSSNASEFVDATQFNDHEEGFSEPVISTPDRVQKDMQFLHESWANFAEKEDVINREIAAQIHSETEARLVDTQNLNTSTAQADNQGFQLVAKKKKKLQKPQSQRGRLNYATRSKVGPSQHSQCSVYIGMLGELLILQLDWLLREFVFLISQTLCSLLSLGWTFVIFLHHF